MWRRLSPWTRVYIVAWTTFVLMYGPPLLYLLYVLWNEPCQCEPGG